MSLTILAPTQEYIKANRFKKQLDLKQMSVIKFVPITCLLFSTNELTLCHKLKIPISLQSDISVNLSYFKVRLFDHNSQFEITTMGCKDIGIRKLEFVTKTRFL